MARTVKDIKVFLNGERLKVKNFKQYVEMYVSSAQAAAAETSGGQTDDHPRTNQPLLGGRIYSFRWPVSTSFFCQLEFHSCWTLSA
jgi:DNA topoisomerase-2